LAFSSLSLSLCCVSAAATRKVAATQSLAAFPVIISNAYHRTITFSASAPLYHHAPYANLISFTTFFSMLTPHLLHCDIS